MTRTTSEIHAEIARLKRQIRDWELEGRLDCEQEDLLLGQITDLYDDLSDIEPTRIEPADAKFDRRAARRERWM
ncbi:MAG TPA: hypothetical protein VIY86_06920 [Pirellulaceae bacterium]